MMPDTSLRIGFDMDGVLADFSSAFRQIERSLFGGEIADPVPSPEDEEQEASVPPVAEIARIGAAEMHRRRQTIWRLIQDTEDFWTTLTPTDPSAVARLHELTVSHRWEVFFITQRPATAGETVQRQTQRWLMRYGFDMPSVLVINGSRGAAAQALRLAYHVDDSAQNCVDVKSDSSAQPILVAGAAVDGLRARQAEKLGIGLAGSIGECLDFLEQTSARRNDPGMFARLATMAGWK
jgi:hypothetical protein